MAHETMKNMVTACRKAGDVAVDKQRDRTIRPPECMTALDAEAASVAIMCADVSEIGGGYFKLQLYAAWARILHHR